ncbi:MAG: hypothetical protein IT529_10385 [Burkholderiales bacterium]|nr:hypothetical protein [Burkholderiales bacterium]
MADRGLWVTWYDLGGGDREAHLAWLHGSYIPRMLARPGFLHAAHYANAGVPPVPHRRHTTDPSIPAGNDLILIFGAGSPHVFTRGWRSFATGAPSRLDEGLTAEDHRMLAMRRGARACILTEEAKSGGPEAGTREGLMLAPCIQIGSFNAEGCDEELLSWYGDWRFPALSRLPGCVAIRKLVASAGWARHAVLYEFASFEARAEHLPKLAALYPEEFAWTNRFTPKLLHAPHSPVVARRLWPAVK